MKPVPSFAMLSDTELLTEARSLAGAERQATAALIACLAEVDARRLYLGEGCSSLFAWCTDVLHLSGDAAYGRIEAARVARRYPVVLQALASGSVSMTVVALLRPYLTDSNHHELLARVHHKSKRQVEQLVAALAPQPDVPASIRRLPSPDSLSADPGPTMRDLLCDGAPRAAELGTERSSPDLLSQDPPSPCETGADGVAVTVAATPIRAVAAPVPTHRSVVTPLAPERFRIQFTVSRVTRDRLLRAQDLLRHALPNGDPAAIFDRALIALITQLEKQKWGISNTQRAGFRQALRGRTIPAAVRRAAFRRDEGRCGFVGVEGRCTATAFLEFHHVVPYARGGAATEDNIQLRCRAHNQYEAEQAFGARAGSFVRERQSSIDSRAWRGPNPAM